MTEPIDTSRAATRCSWASPAPPRWRRPRFARRTARPTGTVFDDRDGTGRAGGNPGLAGVLVSNGREVVATDARRPLAPAGARRLACSSSSSPPATCRRSIRRPACRASITCTAPTARPPSSTSPSPAIAPTGPLPASHRLRAEAAGRARRFRGRAVHRSAAGIGRRGRFHPRGRDRGAGGTKAKFGLTAGDIMFDDLSLYDRYNRIIGTIGLPWWNIGGNHDLNFEAPDRTLSRETFKRVFGPNYYAFFYARTLFLMLDDVDYLGHDPARPEGRRQIRGPARRRAARLRHNSAGADAGRHADRRRHAHPDHQRHRPAGELRPARSTATTCSRCSRAANTRSASPATRIRPSIIYFDAAQGWQGEGAHHHHILTAVSGSWWSGPLRSSRRRGRRQPRRHAERLPHPRPSTASPTRRASCPPRSRTAGRCGSRVDSRFHGAEQGNRRATSAPASC